ncbi:hypothetical protein [Xanthomonas oryzae]|uniref:hypothetical protein n=1 Tax=Xanthomonas oryzae TaxID=347 RepID=UPI0021DA07C4|nr:hypothetical protein [Xanthomonas oryzae]
MRTPPSGAPIEGAPAQCYGGIAVAVESSLGRVDELLVQLRSPFPLSYPDVSQMEVCQMYCRGADTRQQIVKNYELHPIAHVQLLAGQIKKSCTGDELTKAYYCFYYKSRQDSGTGTITCGEHAADHFLQLIGHAGLPLFNPLASQGGNGGTSTSGTTKGPQKNWDVAAKQLYNSINLLVVCWSSPPGPALFDIKSKLEKFSDRPPLPSQVKAINTIIGKDVKKRTMAQMVSELAKNNSLKPYSFSHLDAILAAEGVASNFT